MKMLRGVLLFAFLIGALAHHQNPESKEIVDLSRQIAQKIVQELSKNPKIASIFGESHSGKETADLFHPLHQKLFEDCGSKIPNTLNSIAKHAISEAKVLTIGQYFTVFFSTRMRLAVYNGEHIGDDSTDKMVKDVNDAANGKDIDGLPSLYDIIHVAVDKFLEPTKLCPVVDILVDIFINEYQETFKL